VEANWGSKGIYEFEKDTNQLLTKSASEESRVWKYLQDSTIQWSSYGRTI